MKFKKLLFLFIIFIIALSFFLAFKFVLAQYGLEKFKEAEVPIVETQRNIPQVVGGVIKWILGIIGVVLLALIVYGGVMYATAAGNEEQAKKAKGVLTYSVIGVTVIALAFLITNYVITALFPATAPSLPEGMKEGTATEGQALIDQGNAAISEGEEMIERGRRLIAEGNEEEGRRLVEEGEKRREEGQRLVEQGERQSEYERAEAQRRREASERGRAEAEAEAAAIEHGCNKACQRCSHFNRKCCPGYECRSDVEGGLTEWLPYGGVCVKKGTESGAACCREVGDKCGGALLGSCCEGLICPSSDEEIRIYGERNKGKCTRIKK